MRTQIVINNTQIDLLKEVSLNITKQLIDIQNPEQRKTDRTLTIEIPGSPNNDFLFSYIFDVNIDLDADDSTQTYKHFNPNKKAPATIFIDSLQQLKGYCQLKDITIEHRDKVTYHIVCYGEIGNLFAKIDNQLGDDGKPTKAELTDLDFSEFDHIYSRANVAASWDSYIVKDGSNVSFELGKGYVYPMINYGYVHPLKEDASGSIEHWAVSEFRPGIYVKQYIDKIFEKAGFTYTSAFFNSDFFKRLIVPFNSDQFVLDKDEVDSRLFFTGLSGDISVDFLPDYNLIDGATPIILDKDNVDPYFDNSFQYDATTGIFTCDKTGTYSFQASLNCVVQNTSLTTYDYYSGNIKIKCGIVHRIGSVDKVISSERVQSKFTIDASGVAHVGHLDVSVSTQPLITTTDPITIKQGEQVFITPLHFEYKKNYFYYYTNYEDYIPETRPGYKLLVYASGDTYFTNAVSNATIAEDDTVSINSCIPTGIKQRDFLGSIIKAFNLYTEPNPNVENDLIIEPREDYYTGIYTDWTQKLDIGKEFTISPMAALDAGEYYFKFADDEDELNKTHKQSYDRTYGDYKKKIDNDFVKTSKKIELIFAPTPLARADGDPSERILSNITFKDQSGKRTDKTSKIRLLYYGGMKDCERWSFDSATYGAYYYTQYPYSGHLDDPFNSTFDLGFAPPFKIYYKTTANKPIEYIGINLYMRYWDAQMEEISNKNSKLIEGWFYLTPSDIQGLSFRKYYFIKDAYYRLLKVENYDPVFSKVTKCQFLKVLEYDAPLNVKGSINGGRGTFAPTNNVLYNIPTTDVAVYHGGNTFNRDTSVVLGTNNHIGGTASNNIVSGTGHYILGGSERITVLGGGGNTVYPGLADVTLINSSGITVTSPGVMYVNNQKYFTTVMGDTVGISFDNSPYTLTDDVRTLFCDATDGEITINLPTAENRNGKIFEIMKTDNTINTVYIDGYSSETINGSSGHALTTQYAKIRVTSNGTAWFIF
jgi:hypothetical protein